MYFLLDRVKLSALTRCPSYRGLARNLLKFQQNHFPLIMAFSPIKKASFFIDKTIPDHKEIKFLTIYTISMIYSHGLGCVSNNGFWPVKIGRKKLVVTFIYIYINRKDNFLLNSCFFLFFNPLKMKLSALFRWFSTLGAKKLSVLTRCPLYSVRFMEVFLCEFIRKTAGTLGFCPS